MKIPAVSQQAAPAALASQRQARPPVSDINGVYLEISYNRFCLTAVGTLTHYGSAPSWTE